MEKKWLYEHQLYQQIIKLLSISITIPDQALLANFNTKISISRRVLVDFNINGLELSNSRSKKVNARFEAHGDPVRIELL